jgi:hypothetical protein
MREGIGWRCCGERSQRLALLQSWYCSGVVGLPADEKHVVGAVAREQVVLVDTTV